MSQCLQCGMLNCHERNLTEEDLENSCESGAGVQATAVAVAMPMDSGRKRAAKTKTASALRRAVVMRKRVLSASVKLEDVPGSGNCLF